MKKRSMLAIGLCCVLGVAAVYGLASMLSIHNTMYVGNVSVFFDQNCTLPAQTIAWGTVIPGFTQNITLYVKNYGGKAANLTMTTSNWNPINASQYVAVSWDCQGLMLEPGVDASTLFLSLAANATTSGISAISFDVNIAFTY